MTIEQLLKKKGYTPQEITDLGPLLNNAKFRADLETELSTMEGEVVKVRKDLDEYDRWFTEEITPEHQRLTQEHADAVAEAAANKAKFEAYQKTGMRKQAGQTAEEIAEAERKQAETAAAAAGTRKYVEEDTFNKAFGQTGTAIANGVDLMFDHQELFGGRLNMTKEMDEARVARKPVRQYVEEKYKYAEKRAEKQAAAVTAHEEKIRADERMKMAVEFGSNPNLRPMAPSTSPFVARKKSDAGKQPWDKNPNELSRERLERAISKAAGRGETVNA